MFGAVGRGIYKIGKGAVNAVKGTVAYRFNPEARKYYDETHTIAPTIIEQRVSSEPLNFPKSLNITDEEELSPSEKALRNIKAHQAQFKPRTVSNSGASEYSTNSFASGRSSIGSFSNMPNETRRRRKISWKPVHPRGGKRRNKRTRRSRVF